MTHRGRDLERRRVLEGLERDRRIRELGDRCRMLTNGLDNADNDPELVFGGLRFAAVQAAAARDARVYEAFRRLRPEQLTRLYGFEHGWRPRRPSSRPPAPARTPRLGGVQL